MKKRIFIVRGGKYFTTYTSHNARIMEILPDGNYKLYLSGVKYGYDGAYYYTAKEYIENVLNCSDYVLIDDGSQYTTKKKMESGNF